MPGLSAESKSAKKKLELINAIDTLSSHLHTTFRALSTALAISLSNDPTRSGDLHDRQQAHMAIVLGSSVGAPKARVMLVMSGFEVRHAGIAPKGASSAPPQSSRSPSDTAEEKEVEDEVDSDSDGTEDDSEYSDDDDEDEESSDETPSTPPRSDSSRSASPSSSERSERSSTCAEPSATFLEEQQTLRVADRLLSRTLASACAEADGGLSSELGTHSE